MELQVQTVYHYEVYKHFYRFHLNKGKHYKLKLGFVFLCQAIILLISIASFFRIPEGGSLLFSFITLFLPLFYLFMYCFGPEIAFRSAKKMASMTNQYTFSDTEFIASSSNQEYNGSTQAKYELLYKVYETRYYFYLYISANQAFIVQKSFLAENEILQLRSVISAHMKPKRYIICK